MRDPLAVCLVSGREARVDGTCPEHGSDHCVISVQAGPPAHDCVIPGFQCTHGHHLRTVEWPPRTAL